MAPDRILAVGDGVADALPSAFDPVAVDTASEARRYLDANADAVDCVVMAFDLPDCDGIDLVEWLRADHPHLPVVLYPEHGSERVASDAIAAGVTDYVPRSADVDLGERLRAATRSRPAGAARRLRQLRRSLPDVAFLVDADGRYLDVFAGPETPEYLPDDPARITGRRHEAVLPDRAVETIRPAVDCAIETGATRSVEFRLPAPTDEEWFEARIAPVDAETAVVVTRRITDRKLARRDLRRKRAHLSQAQEIASFGSWYRDFEVDSLWWSETVYDIFGYSPVEDTPTHDLFMSSVHPADREHVRRRWAAAMDGEPYDVEHRVRAGDEVRWVREFADFTFDDDGRPVEAVGVVHDITDRKEYERRLESHNQRLDVLQRVARHDIRNRMNVVIGSTADLRRSMDPAADADRIALLDRIDDAAERLLGIGRQLREAEGIIADDPDRQPVDVPSLATDLVAEFAADNPECKWYVAAPDSLRAWASPSFALAVAEVLENAVEHTDSVRPRIAVVVDDRGSHVELRVVDDGPGIPDVEREILVGDRERSQTVHASGLGLWLTRWIVGNSGGRLDLSEGRTGGTVVTIALDPVVED